MINSVDVIVGLQYGDEGKGKITNSLVSAGAPGRQSTYDLVIRFNGGGNAGHTIYIGGKKFVTHQIPSGILHGVTSIIGPGCVVNLPDLFKEIEYLESMGIEGVRKNLKIDKRVHLVTEKDDDELNIGTTKQGIGPTYASKYNRTGIRVGEIVGTNGKFPSTIAMHPELSDMIVDVYDFFFEHSFKYDILFEGAQGFGLDIDWGDYPYVTSSHCNVGSVCLNGVPPYTINNVFGVAKVYETYVGNKHFNNSVSNKDDSSIFSEIQSLGGEYGATTGRLRKVRWLELDELIRAININGVTTLYINKIDVLREINKYAFVYKNSLYEYTDEESFKSDIEIFLGLNCVKMPVIVWGDRP